MKRRAFLGGLTLTAGACLALSLPALAAKPPSFVEVPLIVSLSDLTGADGVLSDNGIYTSGQQNVRAVLLANTNGNFVFDTNDQPGIDGGRRLVLDFRGQATPFPSAVAFPVDAFIGTLPVDFNTTNPLDNLQTMRAGDVLQRRARLAWVDGSKQYSLRWDGPDNGHTFLSVRCEAESSGVKPVCVQWTVTPDGIAGLYSIPTKGKEVDTLHGSVSMPFSMTLRK